MSRDIEARLLNWAQWARGGLPRCPSSSFPDVSPDTSVTVDLADALLVEQALLRMSEIRTVYWRIVELRYLGGNAPQTVADALRPRRSLTAYKALHRELIAWLDGALSVHEPSTLNRQRQLTVDKGASGVYKPR